MIYVVFRTFNLRSFCCFEVSADFYNPLGEVEHENSYLYSFIILQLFYKQKKF